MHIFFSGIGGSGIGPLSIMAKALGYEVSGSEKINSHYIDYLKQKGIHNIIFEQSYFSISEIHQEKPIDWLVYSSAVSIEQPNSLEIQFCIDHGIKATKRCDFINHIIDFQNQQLIAVAGSHGKSTTTAMIIWLLKALNIPSNYLVGAKLNFADSGCYEKNAKLFVYEADEYDRNFLAFYPYISAITGMEWDHPDTYLTNDAYVSAFNSFVKQSRSVILWKSDNTNFAQEICPHLRVLEDEDHQINAICLTGSVNRRNAWQAIHVVHDLTRTPIQQLIQIVNVFPGVSRRFEKIRDNLYTDYAHTPPKIRGALGIAHEIAGEHVIVIYEGFQNVRQHFIKSHLFDIFDDVKLVYIVPTYLAREDSSLEVLEPMKLRDYLSDRAKEKTEPAELNADLRVKIQNHLNTGDLVLGLSAGTSNSVDEWLRKHFSM